MNIAMDIRDEERGHLGPGPVTGRERFEPGLATTLARARAALEAHYGSRLAGVVLYGSIARGTAEPESDIDLLVLLRGELDFFQELRTLVDLLYPIGLDSDRLISAKPSAVRDFEAGTIQLYRNVAREGLAI